MPGQSTMGPLRPFSITNSFTNPAQKCPLNPCCSGQSEWAGELPSPWSDLDWNTAIFFSVIWVQIKKLSLSLSLSLTHTHNHTHKTHIENCSFSLKFPLFLYFLFLVLYIFKKVSLNTFTVSASWFDASDMTNKCSLSCCYFVALSLDMHLC